VKKNLFDLLLSANRGLLLWSAGDVYIGAGWARDFVQWINQRSELIVRLEGFESDGRAIRPLLDYIADIPDTNGTSVERVTASTQLALRVLSEWERMGGPEFIEFFLESDSTGQEK
jgi:hypothetical protein